VKERRRRQRKKERGETSKERNAPVLIRWASGPAFSVARTVCGQLGRARFRGVLQRKHCSCSARGTGALRRESEEMEGMSSLVRFFLFWNCHSFRFSTLSRTSTHRCLSLPIVRTLSSAPSTIFLLPSAHSISLPWPLPKLLASSSTTLPFQYATWPILATAGAAPSR
jgi:hypothetical protein